MSDSYFKHLFSYKKLKFRLFKACVKGNENSLLELLENIPSMVNCEVSGNSPLVKLIDDHVIQFSPLHLAAEYNKLNICQILVDYNADVNKMHGMGTPLHVAMLHDNENIFNFLIKNGANVNATTADGENAFHLLYSMGSYNEDDVIVKWTHKFIEAGCNVNQACFGCLRPLRIAPEYLVEYLRENGATY